MCGKKLSVFDILSSFTKKSKIIEAKNINETKEEIKKECIQCDEILSDSHTNICDSCVNTNIVKSLGNSINVDSLLDINKIKTELTKLNGNSLWKCFEYYSCNKYDLIPWDLLPIDIKDKLTEKEIYNDCGIDGISSDLLKSLQCKYRDGTNITFREISTFYTLSKGILDCNKLLLEVLNTSKVRPLVKTVKEIKTNIQEKKKFIDDVSKVIYDFNKDKKEVKDKKKECKLRPYQIEAINVFKERLENNEKETNEQLCCGSGKGKKCIIECIRHYLSISDKNILLLVPYKLLYERFKKDLKEFNPHLYDKMEEKKSRVYLCVYNSIDTYKDVEFGLKIIDEAHHLDLEINKNTYRKKIHKLKVDHTLQFSATFHEETEIHYNYTLEQGIREKYINDYEVIVPYFKCEEKAKIDVKEDEKEEKEENDDECKEEKEENDDEKEQIKMEESYNEKLKRLKPQIHKSYLNLIQKRIDFEYILSYHNTIDESKEFCKYLNDNDIPATHMDGNMPVQERLNILKQFKKKKYRVVCSVNVLGEGINLPFVDTCIFVSPRNSFINITQCMGRVLRRCKGKGISHIVLPHMVEENMLSKFLNVMVKNDSRLKDSKGHLSKSRISFCKTDGSVDDENVELETYFEKYNSLEELIKNQRDKRIMKLKKWVEENEKLPSKDYPKNNEEKTLGYFCSYLRSIKRNPEKFKFPLTKYQIDLLELIVQWVWDTDYEDNRIKRIKELKKWCEENKKLPTTISKDEEERSLGQLCSDLKGIKRGIKTRGAQLTKEQIELLESIPEWYWENFSDERIKRIKELKKWVEENKKLPNKRSENEIEKSLGYFCNSLKNAKKGNTRDAELTDEQIELLESIPGWYWMKTNPEDLRMDRIEELKKWCEENKKLPSARSKDSEEKSLGGFCGALRTIEKSTRIGRDLKGRKKLTKTEIKLLELIPKWYWSD
jgi:superfamily II DNA or RNA helicase